MGAQADFSVSQLPPVSQLLLDISHQAIKDYPEEPGVYSNRARVLDYLDVQPDAIQAFEQALRLAPEDRELLLDAATSRYLAANRVAAIRFREETERIRGEIDQVTEQQTRLSEVIRNLELQIDQTQSIAANLEGQLQELSAPSTSPAYIAMETESEIEGKGDEAFVALDALIRQNGITKQALRVVTRWLDKWLNHKEVSVTYDELTKLIRLLKGHPECLSSRVQDTLSFLAQYDFEADRESSLSRQNEDILRKAERALIGQVRAEDSEIGRLQAQLDELERRSNALEYERHRLEQLIATKRQTLDSLRQQLLQEQGAKAEVESQLQDLNMIYRQTNRDSISRSEREQALTWAKQSDAIDSTERSSEIVKSIESSLLDTDRRKGCRKWMRKPFA